SVVLRSPLLLPIQTRLKHYVIGQPLGQGSFGITYRGFDTQKKTLVAIKEYCPSEFVARHKDQYSLTLHSEQAQETFDIGLRSFRNEAQLLKRFYHGHIVRVFNYFDAHRTAYLVMDYYEGETLQAYLVRQPRQRLPWQEALALLVPVLDGLQQIHAQKVLHRDIKPANLYLTTQNRLILLDFGSARQVVAGHSRSLTTILTPGYAPVEQYGVESQGPWTDIYAVAATLYRMITGRTPPPATDRILSDTLQSPVEQIPDIPLTLNSALLQALAVRPQQRVPSIGQLNRQFQAILDHGAETIRPLESSLAEAYPPPNKFKQWTVWLAVAVVVVGITVGVTLGSLALLNNRAISEELQIRQESLSVDHELNVWQEKERCGTNACYLAYLDAYPEGRYAVSARARIEQEQQRLKAATSSLQLFQVFRDQLRDGSQGPAMVLIPKGEFQMGSPDKEVGRDRDAEHQHWVKIGESFAIGQYEITVGEFRQFANATRYRTDAERNTGGLKGCYLAYYESSTGHYKYRYQENFNWKNPKFSQEENHPVVCISWGDAVAYAAWLSEQTGSTYRLPTEAEWEYAARAKTTTARYWGNDPDQACLYANVADLTIRQEFSNWDIHNCTDRSVYTMPVGMLQPNRWKLYDMLGNVWEWTCSAYDKNYSGAEKQCVPSHNWDSDRVARGGAWSDSPLGVRSAKRFNTTPMYRSGGRGFRVVRE
ncbi:MAG TPA: hypothetical protein DCS21_04045, partial [Gammaproteobacteria bacterium]|nr:hypothetical protein [Gammaproteobacteria bacterium]